MTDDREQDRKGSKDASRPISAAARRERRAADRASDNGNTPAAKRPTAKQPTGKRADGKGGADGKGATGTGKTAEKASASKAQTEAKGRPTATRDRAPERVSLLGRLMRFLREVVAELRKVIWPTRKQLITYTTVVLVFVAFMVALVFALDLVFHKAVFQVFG